MNYVFFYCFFILLQIFFQSSLLFLSTHHWKSAARSVKCEKKKKNLKMKWIFFFSIFLSIVLIQLNNGMAFVSNEQRDWWNIIAFQHNVDSNTHWPQHQRQSTYFKCNCIVQTHLILSLQCICLLSTLNKRDYKKWYLTFFYIRNFSSYLIFFLCKNKQNGYWGGKQIEFIVWLASIRKQSPHTHTHIRFHKYWMNNRQK